MGTRRRLAFAAAALALGPAAWEVQRRRDLHAITSDPEWSELHRPLGGRVHRVTADDGTRLHAEVHGPESAPTIVLVHGWVEAVRLWHHQVRDLSEEFRVVAYDQRGHGLSAAPDSGEYSEEALAGDLAAIVDALVPRGERCVLAGHSMGGMAIVAWAGRNPKRVARRIAAVALISTGMHELVARLDLFGSWAGSRALTAAVIRPTFASPRRTPTRIDPISLRLIRRIALAPSASLAQVAFAHQMFLTTRPAARAGFGNMFMTLDLSDLVRHVTAPALVISGELDRLTPPWHAEQLAAALPNLARHTVLPDTGHMSPLESAEPVTAQLRRLVREHAAPSTRARAR